MIDADTIYLKKLLTDAGYDQHKIEGDWIIAQSSYYRHSAALFMGEPSVLALPEKVGMQLNLYEEGNFIPLKNTPDNFLMGMALEIDELLVWLKKSVKLPEEKPIGVTTTDVETLRKERRGQEKLRQALMDYWGGQCAITDVRTSAFLVASHIKPWSECENDQERLDPYNALLLNTSLDRAFDQGYITFDDDGKILINKVWAANEAQIMGIAPDMKLKKIDDRHREYLRYHRGNIWQDF
jgi:hypothetical protein